MQNQSNSLITFDTQLKSALIERQPLMTGIGISRLKRSGFRDEGKILVKMAGLKNPIGDHLRS